MTIDKLLEIEISELRAKIQQLEIYRTELRVKKVNQLRAENARLWRELRNIVKSWETPDPVELDDAIKTAQVFLRNTANSKPKE